MAKRSADAEWRGNLKNGNGTMRMGGGSFVYSFGSRFEQGTGTNPEELIGAAHAGCFSMALSHMLSQAGFTPERIHTKASVYLEKVGEGFQITRIELSTEGEVPGIEEAKFQSIAEDAKKNCPVSKALAGVKISLESKLLATAGAKSS